MKKPDKNINWKGFIYDPYLDNSFIINDGILLVRKLLITITSLGLPIGCEFLDIFLPQYYTDLISWGVIGTKTTESIIHRQLVSGLSMSIGFKNETNEKINIAIDAIIMAHNPNIFLGINNMGITSKIKTSGNKNLHLILCNRKNKSNYYMEDVNNAIKCLKDKNINTRLMIDLSHENSNKKNKNQLVLCNSVCNQLISNNNIIGVIIESNIYKEKQKLNNNLKYDISITNNCVNISTTDIMLNKLYNSIKHRF